MPQAFALGHWSIASEPIAHYYNFALALIKYDAYKLQCLCTVELDVYFVGDGVLAAYHIYVGKRVAVPVDINGFVGRNLKRLLF